MAALTTFALAPQLLPPGYSVVGHSISESAAQATQGAWLARAGLALLGASALLLLDPISRGNRWARIGLGTFGLGLVAAAVWSHSPWIPALPNDQTEDLLHSIGSSLAGAGLINATLATTLSAGQRALRATSLIALAVSVTAPLLMVIDEPHAGLWQRLMFGVAMLWLILSSQARGASRAGQTPTE